jgi:uncharacterized protein YifE (UPF0438 family)
LTRFDRSKILQLIPEATAPVEAAFGPVRQRHPLAHFRDLAIAGQVISDKDDMGVLRNICLGNGMTKAGWRFINRYGKDAYAAILPLIEITGNAFEVASAYVNWQCDGGLKAPLACELGERLIICLGEVYDTKMYLDPRVGKAADDHWRELADPEERQYFTRKEWMQVITWLRDVQPVFDRNQWRSGWRAIYRNFQKWKKLNPAANTWHSALPAFDHGEFHVQPLTSSYDLAQEGYRMQHCVITAAQLCHAGVYRLFSVSEISSGKPLVTIGLRRDGNYWKIDQIKGRLNHDPRAEPARLGLIIQRKYAQEEERVQRTKFLKRIDRVENLRAEHEAYRRKRFNVPEGLKGHLGDEEIGFLEEHGAWLSGLVSEELPPNDFGQVRFIAVTKGILRPKTEQERIWIKYWRLAGCAAR